MSAPAEKFKRGQRLTVAIEKLSIGGRGVARHHGLVIFVSNVAPGDEAEIELTMVKKNFAEARLIHVVKASLHRVTPPCPVALVCGGCSWQQVAYPEQLRQKRLLVEESLRKFSGYPITETTVSEVVPSPKEFRYRNRVQLHHAGPKIGFFERGSHRIVDIDDCPITDERLAREIPRLRRELAHEKQGRIEIYLDTESRFSQRSAGQTTDDEDTPLGSPFSQVNTEQNVNLVSAVVDQAKVEAKGSTIHRLYDFYAGSGNFTFALAQSFPEKDLFAVELNASSVQEGKNRAAREAPRVRFEGSDVGGFLVREKMPEGSLVLLDPPRTGCGPEVMASILGQKPVAVLYVSCHPVTLARDLRPAMEAGYELARVVPFDMFPQTDHVEVFCVLRAPRT